MVEEHTITPKPHISPSQRNCAFRPACPSLACVLPHPEKVEECHNHHVSDGIVVWTERVEGGNGLDCGDRNRQLRLGRWIVVPEFFQ